MPLAPLLERIKASREKASARITYPAKAKTYKRRPYQQEDIKWAEQQKRVIIAQAPGLGKTFVSLEAVVLPAIVACPLNLVEQWADFIAQEYPHFRVVVAAYGDVIKRDAAMKQPFDVLIVNHDMFSRFYMPDVKTLIPDEFHHFRNRDAERSKQLAKFAFRVEYIYGLTATPVYKDVGDLWHLLHIIDDCVLVDYGDGKPIPKKQKDWKWGTYNQFLDRYAVTDNQGWGARVVRQKNERALKEAYKHCLRERTYKEVGMFLPERIDKHVILKLDERFRKNVYDKLRDHYRLELEGMDEPVRYANAGAVLHQLRKILIDDNLLKATKEIIDDTPADQPVIVFVWYKDTASQVAEYLGGVEITGDMDASKRREIAMTGGPDKKRIRVATMASLSEGVDLSEARTVIFIEQDYVPGKNYQAMTRVQRHNTQGRKEPVIAYWMRYDNTVQSIIHEKARSRTAGNALSVLKEALA